MALGALSGFTVAVTADRRAEEQAQLLQRRGATVVHAPVIRTLPLADEAEMLSATEDLLLDPPDLLIVCTASGVSGWVSALEGAGYLDRLLEALERTHIMVRGPKGVEAVHAAGLDVGWASEEATYASVIERLSAQRSSSVDGAALRAAVVLDGAGSVPVVTAARRLGFDVVEVPVYRWDLPADLSPAKRLVASIAEHSVDAVSFTSAHGVANFFSIASAVGGTESVLEAFNTGDVTACAVGPVTAGALRYFGVRFAVEPRSPRLGAMVQTLAGSFSNRNTAIGLLGHPLHLQGRLVLVDGQEVASLTGRERAVLQVLAERGGGVVSKRMLLHQVWGDVGDEHVVEVTVARLRQRLGEAGECIETVMRRGYRLAMDG